MATTTERISFASIKKPFEYPDFLDIQLQSFKDFFQLETNPDNRKNEGLYKVFSENFPITDARNNFILEFLDYYIDALATALRSASNADSPSASRSKPN